MTKPILSAEKLREVLDFDPETGIFLRKVRLAQCHQKGDRADFEVSSGQLKGYCRVGLFDKRYLAHRLAWLHFYGEWPGKMIDHINGVKSDNRITNLRDVTSQLNMQNKRACLEGNPSGLIGAAWSGPSNKWRSRIQVGKRYIQLGMYHTAVEAHEAYVKAKRIYHKGCTI